MLLIAECYANKCVADRLRSLLSPLIDRETRQFKVLHKYYSGRDRILNDVFEKARKDEDLQIILIDYERGIARKYVEDNFELKKVYDKILVGTARDFNRLVAVVFDPDIE